jgi:hypothetical protein
MRANSEGSVATRDELYQVVGRAVTDPAFKAKIQVDPVSAVETLNVRLSDEQKQWLTSKPEQWQNFIKMIAAPDGVNPLDCGTCIVDGH